MTNATPSTVWGAMDTPSSNIIDLRSLYSPPEELAVLLEAHPNTRGAKIDVGYDYGKFARAVDNNRWARQQTMMNEAPDQSPGIPNAMEVLRRAREKRKMQQGNPPNPTTGRSVSNSTPTPSSSTPTPPSAVVAKSPPPKSRTPTPTPPPTADDESPSPGPTHQRKRPKNAVTLSSGFDFLASVPVLKAPRAPTGGLVSFARNMVPTPRHLQQGDWTPPRVFFSVEDSDNEVQVDDNLQHAVSPVKASAADLDKYYKLISSVDSIYTETSTDFVENALNQCKHILIVGLNADTPQIFKELAEIEQRRVFIPDNVGIIIVSGVRDCRPWMAPEFMAKHHSLGHLKFERPRDFSGKAAVDNKMHLLVIRLHKKLPENVGITLVGCTLEPFAELITQMAQKGRSLIVKGIPSNPTREFFHQLSSRLASKSKRLYQAQ